MSQSSGYQYQLFPDSTSSLKSAPPPMVNGQPSAMPHIQNGIQPPHLNPVGTPSSQSSRDQSREPSRDPSPTQYLHNQYRPQLPRPPMPTINGPQVSNRNPTTLPPRVTKTQQYSPTTTPPPNVNVPVSNVVSSGNSSGMPTVLGSTYASTQPFDQTVGPHPVISQSQIPPLSSSQSNSSDGTINKGSHLTSHVGPSKSDITNSNQSLSSMLGPSRPVGSSSDVNNMSPASDKTKNATIITQATHSTTINQTLPTISQSSGQIQPNVTSVSQFNQNIQSQHSPATDQNVSGLPPTTSTLNQFFQSPGQSQTLNPSQSINQPSQGPLPLASGPSRIQSQNVFGPPNPPTAQSTSGYPSQPKLGSSQNLFGNVQSAQSNTQNVPISVHNSNMQNIFSSVPLSQHSSHSQNLTGPQSISSPQVQHPPQSKPQSQYSVQYPSQQNLFGSHPNISGLGSAPQQSQNVHRSQQNLASQRKYPQSPSYGVQQPPISISSPTLGPQRSGIGTGGPGQYQMRPPQPGMPVSSEQQIHGQYDTRQQYPGQMSNVQLDNMTKRYPGSYPDPINQLNSQMSGMSVSQSGFNKLWGIESIDLLQCRNILPPEKIEPPKIKLHQEMLDNVNCNPDIFRCTLTKIPESNSLLQKSRLPLGILVHPFKDLNHLPVIQCSTIVRCRACRTYINPFVYFVDSKRWKCNLCYRVNELPEEFQFDPVTKTYGDPSRRPEVKTSTIEFIAPSEYMLRPPQPAVYLFILDISRLAVDSGYLSIVCNTIADELSKIPGDGRTQIGFLAVDSTIHFYSMPDNVSQPHEIIMSDVDDVFLPCPDNLIVNLKEREELVRDLLAQLPTKYQGTHDTNSALGAGLQAAYKLISPTGGRITVFQTCLPNLGPGSLQPREDPNNRAGKDVPHLNPVTDFYKRIALDCSEQHIAVDLFLLNSQYSDLATLSGMCKFSGGCIYHLPLFRINKPQHAEILERILRRYLSRKVGFEAVMRVRCTRGLSIHTFHGNLFVRSTDLLSLPNVNPDAGFGMQVSIDESLSDVQSVCFQAALLYTSSKGERRIRVHTLCLPVAANLTDILYSADQQCIVGLLSKMAVDRSQQSSLSDARDALINVAIDVLSAYKLVQSAGTGGLLAPSNLKLLPLYIIALLKCIAFRSGTSTRLDDRVFTMCQLKTLPLGQLIQLIYPDLYPVHALDDQNCKDIEGKMCPQPPRLHLSAEKLDSRGAFLLDAGDRIFMYIGKNVHPTFCYNVLGVPAFTSIPEEIYELPELDTVESERLRNFVFSLQEEKPHYASLQIIRDDSHFRSLFTERLIEDRIESALSYYEFLQHLKTQLK